ncbi:MAG: 50S ribosomal protein L18 [Alphaproteobacteria bacterium]|jgi:large subunit ribosomal protein L18|nr:50S ribosomal protein L18 [Alphaproteobacteria bacterium]MBT5389691.1 50S ribosomal protein L18 [Alphaproteobacteria bacterium]MBT5654111.1 50S ribosomal protein L18 [Alphaproteobacteria bacterium]
MVDRKDLFHRRKARVRSKIKRVQQDRPRLSVYRSNKNIYVQIIDDKMGKTLAAASTLDKELKSKVKSGSDVKAAEEVGRLIAMRALAVGIKEVFFDRGGYLYHGRVKALATAARSNGLLF